AQFCVLWTGYTGINRGRQQTASRSLHAIAAGQAAIGDGSGSDALKGVDRSGKNVVDAKIGSGLDHLGGQRHHRQYRQHNYRERENCPPHGSSLELGCTPCVEKSSFDPHFGHSSIQKYRPRFIVGRNWERSRDLKVWIVLWTMNEFVPRVHPKTL